MLRNRLLVLAVLPLILISCVSAPKDDVEVFFLGKNSVQYFFPEREWGCTEDYLKIDADWLYRNFALDDEPGKPRTILNFSLFYTSGLFRTVPRQIALTAGSEKIIIPSEQIEIIYRDRGKTRYTAWLTSPEAESFIKGASVNQPKLSLEYDKAYDFYPDETFNQHIDYFLEVILGLPASED